MSRSDNILSLTMLWSFILANVGIVAQAVIPDSWWLEERAAQALTAVAGVVLFSTVVVTIVWTVIEMITGRLK